MDTSNCSISAKNFFQLAGPEFFYPSRNTSAVSKTSNWLPPAAWLNWWWAPSEQAKPPSAAISSRIRPPTESLEPHLIFNPDFKLRQSSWHSLAHLFGLTALAEAENSKWQVEEGNRQYLFKERVGRPTGTVVLLIDEGQKISPSVSKSCGSF